MTNPSYGEQIKEQLQLLTLKLLGIVQSAEFWTMIVGSLGLVKARIDGLVDSTVFVAGLISLLITFIVAQTVRKVQAMKNGVRFW